MQWTGSGDRSKARQSHRGLRMGVGLLCLCGLFLAGCSDELETGYKFRRLNDEPAVRRGHYADQFAPPGASGDQETPPTGAGPVR